MFFTGQVAEREVGRVKPGMNANVTLVSGDVVSGKVSYVSPSADAQTRTFQTEVELNNTARGIPDGMTATAQINLPVSQSFKILPAWVSLDENGQIGVKTIEEGNRVGFVPIVILSQTREGFWISGIEDGDKVITRGQEYVVVGEVVEPIADPIINAELAQ